jgi:endonuclease/exonuclease/phosphatase family metal-dependent hydrolase
MKLATYNIQYGVGADGVFDLARVAATVKDADIIALQEVESGWERSGHRDLPAEIARLFPDRYVAWGPVVDIVKLVDGQPAGPAVPRRQQGNMIVSRFPILAIRNHLLPKLGAREVLDFQRGAVEALIVSPLGNLRVYSAFLCHLSETQRVLQIQRLKEIVAQADVEGPPLSGAHFRDASWSLEPSPQYEGSRAVLMGDFNCAPNGDAYNELVGELSAKYGRFRRREGYIDCWEVARTRAGLALASGEPDGATRYSSYPPQAGQGRRIDFIFADHSFAERVVAATVLPFAMGSDHAPLFVELE